MPHRDKSSQRQYMRDRRARFRAAGICDACEARPAVSGHRCEPCIARAAVYRREVRQQALDHYGGRCVCCGESEPAFLTFDHVHNDGNQMRRAIPQTDGGSALHYWLRRNGYPDTFQLLCSNCNLAKATQGTCPHASVRALLAGVGS